MIEWEPNKNDANLNIPVDGQVASICWNEQTKLLTMSLAYLAVYGMGERYNGLNQNDRIVKIEVEEKFCNQGDKSYCPSPFFFTDTGFSFCTLSGGTLIFDFTQKNIITVHAPGNCKFIFNAGTPEKLISEYMSLSGPAILPPDWVFGPWISANHWNTQKETEKQIELLKKYQFPATVLVLEAWSDEATFYIFNGAKYKEKPNGGPFAVGDFDYSESAYWPNPQEMIKKLHKAGLHLVLWQVPVYKQQSDDEIRNHQNDLDREDAVKRSLCIHNLDGTPYKIPEGHWFPGSMIPDFTNPETCKTWFGKRQYLLDMGVDGFKTDGGEFVCTDEVSFYDGSTGKESRNCYPQQYTKAYTKFLGDNHVLFSRAGYMGQHTTPCHWGGDQQSTNDELRHVLSAGLSAALSGILFWGFDLAGFAMDGLDDPGDYIASVACEYDKIGEAAIKWIAEQDPEAKIFFCAGQEGAGVYEKYQEGVDRALEELGGDVKVVATLHADWLTDKAYNVTTDLINSGTEFNYIFANNDMMAQGCYNALKDAGKENIPIVSTGGSPDGFKMLQDGIEAANMTAPVSIQGVKTFMNLYNKVALGEDPAEKFTALPVIPVSADDTSSYIAWDDYAAAYKYLGENK